MRVRQASLRGGLEVEVQSERQVREVPEEEAVRLLPLRLPLPLVIPSVFSSLPQPQLKSVQPQPPRPLQHQHLSLERREERHY